MASTASPSVSSSIHPDEVRLRLESLRQAFAADRLILYRRPMAGDELLPISPPGGPAPPPGLLAELLAGPPTLAFRAGEESAAARWARTHGWNHGRSFILPADIRPIFLAILLWKERQPGEARLKIGQAGLEALARSLSPPDYIVAGLRSEESTARPPRMPPCVAGSSRALLALRRALPRVLQSTDPILLVAEAGCGSEELLRWIHLHSADSIRNRPLHQIPLAGLEVSELTARLSSLPPLEEMGSLVLEDPERLSPSAQDQLAGWLQGGRGGSSGPRILCRLRNDPDGLLQRGQLRGLLYSRLGDLRLELPPLRERRNDIPRVAKGLWDQIAPERPLPLGSDALAVLRRASWPGNLRQLERYLRRIHRDFPRVAEVESSRLGLPQVVAEGGRDPLDALLPLKEAVALVEERMLRRALAATEGNKSQAARELRLSRQGLYKKLHRYGLVGDLSAEAAAGEG